MAFSNNPILLLRKVAPDLPGNNPVGVLFLTAVGVAVVAKLVILDILLLTSFILALREALVAYLVISGILS